MWKVGDHILITHPFLAKDAKPGSGRPAIVVQIFLAKELTLKHSEPDSFVLLTKGSSPTATEQRFHEDWCIKVENDPTTDDAAMGDAIAHWLKFFGELT